MQQSDVATILSLPERPTALCVWSDHYALPVIHELRSNGVRVPEDISVAGHDGSDVAASIKLTTMAQPAREIGRIAHNHPDRADARRYDAANRSRIAIGWPADGKGRRTGLQPIE